MSNNDIDKLVFIANDFGHTAEKVNESSKQRKVHALNLLKAVDSSIDIDKQIFSLITKVAEADHVQASKDYSILLSCKILILNIEKQEEIIKELKNSDFIKAGHLEKINNFVVEMRNSLFEAISSLEMITSRDSEIILHDKVLKMRKQFQMNSISALKKISLMTLEDAEKSINGSAANLERGMDLVQKFRNVKSYIEKKSLEDLKNLALEAKTGWETAESVNSTSRSQFEFAEHVNEFTNNLHDDSAQVQGIIEKKHHVFEETLQNVTVLTVIISLKFKQYLNIENLMNEIDYKSEIREKLNELNVLVGAACADIRELIDLNYNMTEHSHLTNETEQKAVDLTMKEIEIYERIKNEVGFMTKATAYPIEGSLKNIDNGKNLEKMILNVIASLS